MSNLQLDCWVIMKPKIREANTGDVDEIVRLDRKLSDQHSKIDDYYKPASKLEDAMVRDWLIDSIREENSLVLVFENEGKLRGYFVGVIEDTKPFIRPSREGRIAVTYVEPEWRKQGFAHKATERFKEFCKKEEIRTIRLSVHSHNHEATKAWGSLGFHEYMKKMRMDI